MNDITDNQKRDRYKFFDPKADASFVARHNRDIVDEVIKDTERVSKMKSRQFEDKLRERSDAVATYLKSVEQGKEKNVSKYFGKKNLAHLRGEQILETIKGKAKILSDIKN